MYEVGRKNKIFISYGLLDYSQVIYIIHCHKYYAKRAHISVLAMQRIDFFPLKVKKVEVNILSPSFSGCTTSFQ